MAVERNRGFIFDRGGRVLLGELDPKTTESIRWERVRDDISLARAVMHRPGEECVDLLRATHPVRHELVIYRGTERVWEGPITRKADGTDGRVTIEARDVMQWTAWAIIFSGYNDIYPNCKKVHERVRLLMDQQLARFEALDPAINVLPHVLIRPGDAGECRELLKHEKTLWEELDSFARYSGIDYTTVGRRICFFDTHDNAFGRTLVATEKDFLGELVVTKYGMEFATFASATDGEGHYGWAGGVDAYYGLVEKLHTIREEGDSATSTPSREALRSSAANYLEGRNPVPTLVRVPDNSVVNPNSSTLTIDKLVPGVRIPLRASLTLEDVQQMQKLNTVTVEEGPEGETIKVTMATAPESQLFPEGDDTTDEDEED